MAQDRFARVLDHVEQGLALLLDQYKYKPRLEAWLSAYLRQVQELENATYDVIILRLLDVATGAQLATLGKIVGQPNSENLGDDEYRIFIRARILINRSTGDMTGILAVLDLISDTPLTANEYFPASMLFEFEEFLDHDPELVATMLRDAKAAGVWLGVVVPTALPINQFLYMSVGDTSVSTHAYGDSENPDTFGLLSDGVFTPR